MSVRYSKGMRLKLERAKKCFYCDRWLSDDDPKSHSHKTIDHFIPKSKGGRGISENLVICCATCNRIKDDFLPDEFIEKLKVLIQWRSFQLYTESQIYHIIYKVEQFKENSYVACFLMTASQRQPTPVENSPKKIL